MPETTSTDVRKLVDASGPACPGPIMLLSHAIREAAYREVIEMIATDSSTQKDVPNLYFSLGHQLISHRTDGTHYWFCIRKGTGVSFT